MPRKNNPKPELTIEYRHVDCLDAEQRIKQAIKIIWVCFIRVERRGSGHGLNTAR